MINEYEKKSRGYPKIVAFIPARGGSKSIPLKNIKNFAGKPLIYWGLLAAQLTDKIEKIYVSTDSFLIRDRVKRFAFSKTELISRSAATVTDTATTESAILEFAKKINFEILVLIQATSPLLTSADLSKAIDIYLKNNYDSMLSAVRQRRFIWDYSKKEGAFPVNYNYKNRPRRQEFTGYLVENGAFYIFKREDFLKSKNRFNGKIGIYEMPAYAYHELDEKEDWIVLESLANNIEPFKSAIKT